MHIEFKKVILHNFISFGHSELQFNDDGFIRVSGINENPADLAISNGSGKSSLWESIIWALTGDTIRGTKHISNIFGTDGTFVELEFLIDSILYNIRRSKDHKEYKTNLVISIDGKDCSGKGIRESEKLLAQYLPDITASLLGSVIILGQGLPQKFTNNTPSGRKEVLEKLSKSDFMIEDLKNRVAVRKKELSDAIQLLSDKIIELTSTRNHLLKQIEDSQLKLKTLDKLKLEEELFSIESEQQNNTHLVEALNSDIRMYERRKHELSEELVTLSENLNNILLKIDQKYEALLQPLQQKVNDNEAELKTTQREITTLENIKEFCPTCGQRISAEEAHAQSRIRLEELKKLLYTLQEKRMSLKEEVNTVVSQRDAEKTEQSNITNNARSVLSSELKTVTASLDQSRNSLSQYIQIDRKCSENILSITAQLAHIEATIQGLNDIITENSNQIQSIDSQLLYNNNEKEIQQSRLSVMSKFDTALKRDFRGYLLSTIIEFIQSRARLYSLKIFETDKILFELEGNNINISYMGRPYENLSGGERQKVDLIIQFSIRDMLCSHLGFTSNILVLDEVFDGLDMIGCQKVLNVISDIEDIKNIFIVTHRKDLSIPTDKELIVVKSPQGISELRHQ